MLNLANSLAPVFPPEWPDDPSHLLFRGIVQVLSTPMPLDLNPAAVLLAPGPDALHTVESVAIPLGGQALPGLLFAPKYPTGPTVVLAHGTTAEQVLPYFGFLRAFLRAGFRVLTLELDGHGHNPRSLCASGLAEDLPAAIAYLRTRSDVDGARIGLMGFSLGGACVLNAAARDGALRAVTALCTPHSLAVDQWGKLQEAFGMLSPDLIADCFEVAPKRLLAFLQTRMRVGSQPEDTQCEHLDLLHPATLPLIDGVVRHLDPLGSAGRLSDTALLVINGEWDHLTPPWQAEDLFAHAAGPRALKLVPRRNHFTIVTSRQAIDAALRWFQRWL